MDSPRDQAQEEQLEAPGPSALTVDRELLPLAQAQRLAKRNTSLSGAVHVAACTFDSAHCTAVLRVPRARLQWAEDSKGATPLAH